MSIILMTILFYKALILKGENWFWSLLGLWVKWPPPNHRGNYKHTYQEEGVLWEFLSGGATGILEPLAFTRLC